MPSRFMWRVIVIYQLIALMGWLIVARRTDVGLQWIEENIHGVVYITLATTMLFVTFVYIVQWSLDKLRGWKGPK